MKFKRLICLLLSLVTVFCIATTAFADQNWTGDDGETDIVSPEGSFWSYYLQGIRLSVFHINTKRILATADYSNLSNEQIHNYPTADGKVSNIADNWFGYNSKLYYMKGGNLNFSLATYSVRDFKVNGQKIYFPDCINQDDTSNFAAVKKFFADDDVLATVAADFGMDYDTLTSGDYKLILEPVVYFRYAGDWYAMTAAEAGAWKLKYGSMASTGSIVGMTDLTELTLPICMFLEYDDNDVGIVAYTGGKVKQPGAIIRDQMGVGILSAEDMLGEETEPCCDCDPFCPCKFNDDGTKRPGPCRCFEDPVHDHEEKIPCTPDYPPNCLCQTGSLYIKKVDAQNNRPLAGATFSIKNKTTGETKVATSGSDGLARFDDLHIGHWVITESSAPSGYVASSTTAVVSVSANQRTDTTFTNEKKQKPTVPVTGKNIIWGYQLTKSFTNPTNFSNYVNAPVVTPSTGCPGSPTGYSSGCLLHLGYGTLISSTYHEHEVTITVGYDEETGTAITETYTYPCATNKWRHDNAHRIGYKLKNHLIVRRAAYIGSSAFLDGGMGKFRIMHNGGNYKLQFNLDSDYHVYRTTDLLRELIEKTWISHRNGGLTAQSQELRLASYMNRENSSYIKFYKDYTGYTPHEASGYIYSDSKTHATVNGITTRTTHGALSTVTRYYDGTYCNQGVQKDETINGTANSATQKYEYSVEGTYKALARTWSTAKEQTTHSVNTRTNTVTQIFQIPSNTFTFQPTYKMWYTDTLGSNDIKEAWMLSAGQRTFQATDVLKITNGGGQTDVWAPWSRDWVDKYTDNSSYGSEQSRGYSVIKAGMVVRAVSANPTTITITAAFHVQDPAFAPESQKTAVARANEAKAREMQQAVDAVVAQFTTDPENTYGFYSNLWEATSENIVDNSNGALDMPCESWAASESPKTRLNIAESFTPTVTTNYNVYRGGPDAYKSSAIHKNMQLNGKTYTSCTTISPLDTYTGTTGTVAKLLDTSLSATGRKNYIFADANSATTDPTKTRWYEEFYDGIRVCEIVTTIKIAAGDISTDYHQVHSQLSDSTTDMNILANNLQAPIYGYNLFSDGMYGIGLCAVTEDPVKFGGKNFGSAYLFWPPKEFGVRGSVYDLAQSAPQQIIKLR